MESIQVKMENVEFGKNYNRMGSKIFVFVFTFVVLYNVSYLNMFLIINTIII